MVSKTDKTLCSSCRQAESTLTIRHRNFCRPCASKFIVHKFKRQWGQLVTFFEDLKKDQKKDTNRPLDRVIAVVDSSPASEALLKMLVSYYCKDEEKGKYTGYKWPSIDILDTSPEGESRSTYEWSAEWMRYTRFSLSLVPQDSNSVLCYDKGTIRRMKGDDSDTTLSLDDTLKCFTADAQSEVRSVLYSRIISTYTKGTDLIIYPDTATQIAAKVLSLTSQGRGYTLPWECGSLVKMPNGVYSAKPLKDLSDTEISVYLDILHGDKNQTSSAPVNNKRATTIDEIMSKYFADLEVSFPSIVATTGRTADKLDFPTTIEDEPSCVICNMPKRADNVRTWLENITVTQPPATVENSNAPQNFSDIVQNGEDITGQVCYGCYTLFRSSRGLVPWPM